MRTHVIAPLGKPLSVIGMGTMIFHPDTQMRDSALLDAFIANGGTYIDTAEVYGAIEERGYSEMVIGAWLASRPGIREKIVLASKGLIPGYCALIHPGDRSNQDLVRVFYSDGNFARKRRAAELAEAQGLSMFEGALGYVINQDFPVVALNGGESVDQVATSAKAGDLKLTAAERDWLDLTSDKRPF